MTRLGSMLVAGMAFSGNITSGNCLGSAAAVRLEVIEAMLVKITCSRQRHTGSTTPVRNRRASVLDCDGRRRASPRSSAPSGAADRRWHNNNRRSQPKLAHRPISTIADVSARSAARHRHGNRGRAASAAAPLRTLRSGSGVFLCSHSSVGFRVIRSVVKGLAEAPRAPRGRPLRRRAVRHESVSASDDRDE